jgi:hypothetical protein
MRYNFEKDFLEKVEDKTDNTNLREKISDTELINLKGEFPKISSEFLDYLSEIGSGNFRESQFKV